MSVFRGIEKENTLFLILAAFWTSHIHSIFTAFIFFWYFLYYFTQQFLGKWIYQWMLQARVNQKSIEWIAPYSYPTWLGLLNNGYRNLNDLTKS